MELFISGVMGKSVFCFDFFGIQVFKNIRLGVDHVPATYLLSFWAGWVGRGCSANTDWVTGLADKV